MPPVSSALPGCFSMLKFLKCSQAFCRQKIFLPGMAGTVGIEQTHKAIFDRRIEIVAQKVFPVRQIHLFHHSLDRTRIVTDCQYEFLTGGIFRNQLVGYLWGTCGVLVRVLPNLVVLSTLLLDEYVSNDSSNPTSRLTTN